MSGTGDDGVKVTIAADSSGFSDGADKAARAASNLAASLRDVGAASAANSGDLTKASTDITNVATAMLKAGASAADVAKFLGTTQAAVLSVATSLRQLTPEVLGTGSNMGAMAAAILKATDGARAAAVQFAAFSTAGMIIDEAFKSAAESADVFIKALNPTPVQALRTLMGDVVPAAFRLTQSATMAVVGAMTGLTGSFKSAEESAAVFLGTINPTATQAFRNSVAAMTAANVVAGTTIHELIAASTGLGAGFKSAADSAVAFESQIERLSLTQLRASLTALPPAIRDTAVNFRAAIDATTGVDRSFKSAAESADAFSRELARIPMAGLRTALLDIRDAGSLSTRTLQENIDSANGIGRSFTSAADSANVFSAAINPAPLATLRAAMNDTSAGSAVMVTTIDDAIAAGTGLGVSFKSASDSATAFIAALSPSPLRAFRDAMTEAAGAVVHTRASIHEMIDAATQQDGAFKSAADSAAVFQRGLDNAQSALQRLRALTSTSTAETHRFGLELATTARGSLQFNQGIKSAADSAAFFAEQLEGVQTPLQRMRALMGEDLPAAAGRGSHGTSMMTMEFIRLGHEGLVGNWTHIPGTLMVVAEYSDTVRNALGRMISSFTLMQGVGVGAVLAVAAAFVTMVYQAHEAAKAINEATNAATMQGRSPGEARAQMAAYGEQMKATGVMGATAMVQVASSISQLGELTEQQKSKIAGVGTALFLNWQSDAKKTGEELQQIFASTSSLDSYLQKQHLLSTEQQTAWSHAATAAQKYDIGIAAITARLGPMTDKIKQAGKDASANWREMIAGAETPGAGMALQGQGGVSMPQHLGDFDPGTKQADPGAAADTQAVIEGNKHLQEKIDLEARLAAEKRDLARATSEGNAAEATLAQSAIEATQTQITLWRAAGDTTWEAKQQGALNTILTAIAAHATSSKQLMMDENRARVTFWEQQAKAAGLTESQIAKAQENAARARLALVAEELRGGEVAAKQSLMERLAAMSAEQAANHDNFAAVMQIEARKLALIQTSVGQQTKLYQDELAKQATLEREHAKVIADAQLQVLATARSVNTSLIADFKAVKEEEAAEGKITVQQEIAALRTFAAEKHALELQGLATLRDSLGQQTAAYRAAAAEWTKLAVQFHTADEQLNRQAVAAQKRTWDEMTAPVTSAINSQVGAVLRGNETIGAATVKMLEDIVIGYVEMGVKKLVLLAEQKVMEIAMGKATQDAVALSQVATQAVVAGAAAFADSAQLGPAGLAAAPAAAAAASATVSAMGATLPGLATGAWDVPQNMGANLHAGEMVIPASFAAGLRGAQGADGAAGASGGGTVSFNIYANDGASVRAMLAQHAPFIAQQVSRQQSRNPSTRASF